VGAAGLKKLRYNYNPLNLRNRKTPLNFSSRDFSVSQHRHEDTPLKPFAPLARRAALALFLTLPAWSIQAAPAAQANPPANAPTVVREDVSPHNFATVIPLMTPLENPMSNNDSTVSKAIENFYLALNVLFTGDAGPIKDAWSHADDITYMGPEGAYLRGWDAIGPLWDEVAALKLGGHIRPKQLHIVSRNDMALITCIEAGENMSKGTAETVGIRSSTVFRIEDGNWKVIHHQTDKLSFLDGSK